MPHTIEEMLELGIPDSNAFLETLLTEYGEPIFRYCYRMLGNRVEAEDAAADTFVRVMKRVGEINSNKAFKTWVFRIARNRCIDRMRQKPLLEVPETLEVSGDDERTLVLRVTLQEALKALPEMWRDPLVLCDLENLSAQEAARILDISLPALKSRLYRGRKALRDSLCSLYSPSQTEQQSVPQPLPTFVPPPERPRGTTPVPQEEKMTNILTLSRSQAIVASKLWPLLSDKPAKLDLDLAAERVEKEKRVLAPVLATLVDANVLKRVSRGYYSRGEATIGVRLARGQEALKVDLNTWDPATLSAAPEPSQVPDPPAPPTSSAETASSMLDVFEQEIARLKVISEEARQRHEEAERRIAILESAKPVFADPF